MTVVIHTPDVGVQLLKMSAQQHIVFRSREEAAHKPEMIA
jgi:hypothetical protein